MDTVIDVISMVVGASLAATALVAIGILNTRTPQATPLHWMNSFRT